MYKRICRAIGGALARYLSQPNPRYVPLATVEARQLKATLEPCDVLLVEGNTRFSTAVKYLTQSTWSHAALYVGECAAAGWQRGNEPLLIEADVAQGVIAVPLSKYDAQHTRICRARSLSAEDKQKVIAHALSSLGNQYDLKNVFDLARYLFPTPPIPSRWRRRALRFGSGDPTRAICSTLIAQAFQSARYPILPNITKEQRPGTTAESCNDCVEEIWHIRHYSLFAPRDFDISPYFAIVKPAIAVQFDHHDIVWEERS